jgi:acetyl esterase/lipase
MRSFLTSLCLALSVGLAACGGGGGGDTAESGAVRYAESIYSSTQIEVTGDLEYSTRDNPTGLQFTSDLLLDNTDPLRLKLDVYTPPSHGANRPLLVYIHGGGYKSGNKESLALEAVAYARMGYVVASINYRLTPENDSNAALRLLATVNANDDLQNAIRYLKTNAARWQIDTTRVGLLGMSAGGGMSLVNAVQADDLQGTTNDYPGVSAHVQAAVSTGATLIEPLFDTDELLDYDASDTPVLLFHVQGRADSATGATWEDNVVPTKTRIDGSGNSCQAVPTPEANHTVSLAPDGTHWATVRDFLWERLNLASAP